MTKASQFDLKIWNFQSFLELCEQLACFLLHKTGENAFLMYFVICVKPGCAMVIRFNEVVQSYRGAYSPPPGKGDIIFDVFGKLNEKWDIDRQVFYSLSYFLLKNHLFSPIERK